MLELTGEHGDLVDVVEFPVAFAAEGCPQVCDENLGALQEANRLALELGLIPETGKIISEQVDQLGCGTFGVRYQSSDAAVKLLRCHA